MDSTSSLLSPRSSPSSPFSFSPSPSPSSSPSSSSSSSFSFSPLPSPRPITSASASRRSAAGFSDLDSSSSSIWGSPTPFTTLLQQPPPFRPRPSAINVSNFTTTAEPPPATHSWATSPRRTYYDLLGVEPSSSPRELRSAYRRLALQHHPDVSPLHQLDTATKFFAEINEAYTVLSDPQKKACYDLKLALESPSGVAAMSPMEQMHQQSAATPRKYTDATTGRVYPSMNSFYRDWRRAHA
ncbi:hypothetical protein L7F22_047182 [Adiantum nelumboides]|nr:hypothetical protein [Adiantum nelumboides]